MKYFVYNEEKLHSFENFLFFEEGIKSRLGNKSWMNNTHQAYFLEKGFVISNEIRDFPVAPFVATLHHFVNNVQ